MKNVSLIVLCLAVTLAANAQKPSKAFKKLPKFFKKNYTFVSSQDESKEAIYHFNGVVTNSLYKEFVDNATPAMAKKHQPVLNDEQATHYFNHLDNAQEPVKYISQDNAVAYCDFLEKALSESTDEYDFNVRLPKPEEVTLPTSSSNTFTFTPVVEVSVK